MVTYHLNGFLFKDPVKIIDFNKVGEQNLVNSGVNIIFDYFFSDNWHLGYNDEIRIVSVIDSKTNDRINHDSLPVQLQIELRRHCFDFLDKSNLRLETNIIPLYQHPIKLSGHGMTQLPQPAKIIPFSRIS